MAIQYTTTGIIITDDSDSSKPPLFLPIDTPTSEVGAAAALYSTPEPDLMGFGIWLLTNELVREFYEEAFADDKLTTGVLQPSVLEAMSGDTGHLRTVILMLRRKGLLKKEVLDSIKLKAQEFRLPEGFIRALG